MKTISVPTDEQVSPETRLIFEKMKKRMGKVPNLYATMGYSEHALKAFLGLEEQLSGGIFSAKEREAVALAVSEINQCDYCLAGHTQSAIRYGFTLEDTLDIRRGLTQDPKITILIQLAQSFTQNQGRADLQLVDNFFSGGYNEAALMELIGFITVRVFTNYVYAVTKIPIDFPPAAKLGN
ncbi:carboxymuconolactone decarboxylase family protein [Pedobacter lithocola]|uniref:Carboxymuconolactone decarboxylase family protein n=1 Tax=Pedobacter lithocola TaxID=1908239 RepID=A0ABV8P8V0_9SPHI